MWLYWNMNCIINNIYIDYEKDNFYCCSVAAGIL